MTKPQGKDDEKVLSLKQLDTKRREEAKERLDGMIDWTTMGAYTLVSLAKGNEQAKSRCTPIDWGGEEHLLLLPRDLRDTQS